MSDHKPQVSGAGSDDTKKPYQAPVSPQKDEHVAAVAQKIEDDNLLSAGKKTDVQAANAESATMSADELVTRTKEEEGKKNIDRAQHVNSGAFGADDDNSQSESDSSSESNPEGEESMSDNHGTDKDSNKDGSKTPGQSQPGKTPGQGGTGKNEKF